MGTCQSCGLLRSCDPSQPFTFNNGTRGATGANGTNGADGVAIIASACSVAGDTTAVVNGNTYDLDSFIFDNTNLFESIGDEVSIEFVLAEDCGGSLYVLLDDGVTTMQLGDTYVFTHGSLNRQLRINIMLTCLSLTGADNIFTEWSVEEGVTNSGGLSPIVKEGNFIMSNTIDIPNTYDPGITLMLDCDTAGDITLHKFVVKRSKKI